MKLDRTLQLDLLNQLAEEYPRNANVQQLTMDNPSVTPNLHYLYGHGLVDGDISQEMSGQKHFHFAKITHAGLDFLADDGGLSAILGVVTVKLHDETIRQLVAARIETADIPVDEKRRLLDQLRGLRGESIKHLTMKLLDAGLENWPAALLAIQKFL